MSETSGYWTTNKKEINKLTKERDRLNRELELLRQRDILKANISRQKKEKFYRSGTGKVYLTGIQSAKAVERKLTSPGVKKTASKLTSDLKKLSKKLMSEGL